MAVSDRRNIVRACRHHRKHGKGIKVCQFLRPCFASDNVGARRNADRDLGVYIHRHRRRRRCCTVPGTVLEVSAQRCNPCATPCNLHVDTSYMWTRHAMLSRAARRGGQLARPPTRTRSLYRPSGQCQSAPREALRPIPPAHPSSDARMPSGPWSAAATATARPSDRTRTG